MNGLYRCTGCGKRFDEFAKVRAHHRMCQKFIYMRAGVKPTRKATGKAGPGFKGSIRGAGGLPEAAA